MACALLGSRTAGAGPPAGGGEADPVRIMPLGDSITRGSMGAPKYAPGGYRAPLYQRLRGELGPVEFVGSQVTNPAPGTLPDPRHEGHSGYLIDGTDHSERGGLFEHVDGWLDQARPHVVLLLIGANDVNQDYELAGAPDRLARLITKIASHRSKPAVIVAQIPGSTRQKLDRAITRYNGAMPDIVEQQRAAGHAVFLVDMYRVIKKPDDFGNFLHPNEAGYRKMADVWFEAVRSTLTPKCEPSP